MQHFHTVTKQGLSIPEVSLAPYSKAMDEILMQSKQRKKSPLHKQQ